MTSDVMKQLCEKFWEIGVRMAERFPQIGQTYLDSIQPLRPDDFINEKYCILYVFNKTQYNNCDDLRGIWII
uniref:Uncharacterized protein n=1 Tax=Magallana gigas TaxID=29159 RepID=K1Q2V1_MAGGI